MESPATRGSPVFFGSHYIRRLLLQLPGLYYLARLPSGLQTQFSLLGYFGWQAVWGVQHDGQVLHEAFRLKKIYWVIAVLVFIFGLDWYIQAPDSRSRVLTGAIEAQASPKLKSYPYKFWVMRVDGSTAVMSTPRNFDVPAFKALAVLYPDINTKDANNPAFIAVEQLLGEVQGEARAIVLAQPGIKDVTWELDREWLRKHFIEVPEKR